MGAIDIGQNSSPVTGFATQKARALFVYLAVTRQPHTRDHLATLLWGTLDDAASRRALRYVLWNLRQILAPYLKITRHTISFNDAAPSTSDVQLFAACTAKLSASEPSDRVVEDWRTALGLYRGDFLRGFHIRDAEEFDAWMLLTRERFHRNVLDVLSQLIAYEKAQENSERGIEYARRLLELEPWNEAGHRALMQLFLASGNDSAAWMQFETCQRVLKDELNAEPDAATMEWAQRLRARAQADSDAAPNAPKHNLPPALNPFFGREQEIQHIADKFSEPTCRLVTLTGEGGIGKTRLALEAATRLVSDFPDGVWFVPLSGVLSEPDEIPFILPRAIARALGLSTDSSQDRALQLNEFLRTRQLLLVLDNLEHFLFPTELEHAESEALSRTAPLKDGADWVHELLSKTSGVRLLVTSRARLNLGAEYVMRLNGLDVPDDADENAAQAFSAIRLFLERAERAGIAAGDMELAQITRLCQLVEGLPLAIELAASWMNRTRPDELLRDLQANLDAMATSRRDVPPRHRSLRAVFENSWRLLSPVEQTVLKQSGIFNEGFTRAAAEYVIDMADRADDSARSRGRNSVRVSMALDALADKSLVRWVPRSNRFRMHTLIRQLALEKMESGENDTVRHRHAFCFLEFAAEHQARLLGQDSRSALVEIQEELGNIRAAWDWCVEHRQYEQLAAALRTVATFFDYAGLAREGLALLTRTAQELEKDVTVPRGFVLQIDLWRAFLMHRMGELEQAQWIAKQTLQQAQVLDQTEIVAWSRYVYAVALARLPDTEAELEELAQACSEAQAIQDKRLEALCEMQRGIVIYRTGNFRSSRDLFTRALSLFQLIQDSRYSALAFGLLGVTQYLLGQVPEAVASLERAIEIADTLADKIDKGILLFNLGIVLSQQGQYEKAIEYTKQSEQNFRVVGSVRVERCYVYRGFYAAQIGNWVEARHILESYVAARVADKARREDVWAYWGLSLLARRQGRITDAVRYGHLALEAAQHWSDLLDQAETAAALADAAFEQGDLDTAEENYHLSLVLREKMQQEHIYAEAMTGLAHIALRRGEIERARAWIDKAWPGESLRLAQGSAEPFWIYWTSYQVMRALGDPRAGRLLETAQTVLSEYASQITDPQTRDQYLQVPWHRAILQASQTPQSLPLFMVSDLMEPQASDNPGSQKPQVAIN